MQVRTPVSCVQSYRSQSICFLPILYQLSTIVLFILLLAEMGNALLHLPRADGIPGGGVEAQVVSLNTDTGRL